MTKYLCKCVSLLGLEWLEQTCHILTEFPSCMRMTQHNLPHSKQPGFWPARSSGQNTNSFSSWKFCWKKNSTDFYFKHFFSTAIFIFKLFFFTTNIFLLQITVKKNYVLLKKKKFPYCKWLGRTFRILNSRNFDQFVRLVKIPSWVSSHFPDVIRAVWLGQKSSTLYLFYCLTLQNTSTCFRYDKCCVNISIKTEKLNFISCWIKQNLMILTIFRLI